MGGGRYSSFLSPPCVRRLRPVLSLVLRGERDGLVIRAQLIANRGAIAAASKLAIIAGIRRERFFPERRLMEELASRLFISHLVELVTVSVLKPDSVRRDSRDND